MAKQTPEARTRKTRVKRTSRQPPDGSPTIDDVFQAKRYGELYSAEVALLISSEQPEERLRRLLVRDPSLLAYAGATWSLYLCWYSKPGETIDWWFEKKEPRLK